MSDLLYDVGIYMMVGGLVVFVNGFLLLVCSEII